MLHLTISQQNYIKAVYELSFEGRGTRICNIALKYDVSKASVCIAMKTLQKKKRVYRGGYRGGYATKSGEYQAQDKITIIREFLINVLYLSDFPTTPR